MTVPTIAMRGCHRRTIASAWIVILLCLFGSTAAPAEVAANAANKRATLAIRALQSWYDQATGLYRTTGWWNSANAITTLADYSTTMQSHEFDPVFSNTFAAAQKTSPGFLNRYYDDEGWWALAWIDVYDITGDSSYLAMAKSIFADMAGGWDDTCSGGIWWSKDRKYKNAIANELFLSVAAHLASRSTSRHDRKQYLTWAQREWRWFSASGMINADHLVNDGLDAKCANNQRTIWTYNQGVILGGLAELFRINHDSQLLTSARTITEAALSAPRLIDEKGILHDTCEPNCGADGSQFKGIFARNLRSLDVVSPLPEYKRFVTTNADSIWSGAHPPDYHLGLIWAPPFGPADASTQSSAADLLVAASSIDPSRSGASNVK